MNATLQITTDIADFARRVREQLGDLPADEVDDLTDGLEADMAEAFAENARHELPDAKEYAFELRNAAGLPEREAPAKTGLRHSVRGLNSDLRVKREHFAAELRKSPVMAGFLDFLVELRPFWWVARAWIAFQLAMNFVNSAGPVLPIDTARWALLLLFVLFSVQWGRGRWLPFGRMAPLIVAGNVFAVLLILPTMGQVNAFSYAWDDNFGSAHTEPPSGTAIDGQQVSNIYAYDAEGNPLRNVQLFDETGRPLVLGAELMEPQCDANCRTEFVKIPSVLRNGLTAWNVFPMQQVPSNQTTYDDAMGRYRPSDGVELLDTVAPFVKVPALLTAGEITDKDAAKVDKGND